MAALPPMSGASQPNALIVGLLLAAAAAPAHAGGLHGRIEVTDLGAVASEDSLDAALGARSRNDLLGDLRLTWESRRSDWDFIVHYELSADLGRAVKLQPAQSVYFPETPPSTLFDLTTTSSADDRTLLTQTIDRLAIGYSAPDFVVRVGRQALTWGAGTMFHPMDLVDPFAPNTVDTEYKPGVDMAYMQWLYDDGSDLQLIAVPRRIRSGSPVAMDASTLALQYHHAVGELGTTWLLARDHGDWTVGLGVGGALGGAVWNVEVVPTFEQEGRPKTSALANISTAMTLLQRNATVFAEYYHNGFGITGSDVAFDALPAGLTDRLARGQVFNTSKSYLAAGMTLEWTPLLNILPSIIVNLDDGSLYTAAEGNWSLSDNSNLILGAQVPVGRDGTEYGGLPASGSSAPYVAPALTVYLQLRRHF